MVKFEFIRSRLVSASDLVRDRTAVCPTDCRDESVAFVGADREGLIALRDPGFGGGLGFFISGRFAADEVWFVPVSLYGQGNYHGHILGG